MTARAFESGRDAITKFDRIVGVVASFLKKVANERRACRVQFLLREETQAEHLQALRDICEEPQHLK
ncbi:hypothetical protein ASD07_05305 [Duganella sp. Root336D2]|nr:hypothetical protein ASD07_05305 [Duganella sp. Root336D2]